MKTNILGVKIDDVNMAEVLSVVEKWIWNPGKYYVVTPNPEFIVAAQKDPVFKKILNDANLAIPDGAGLKLSGKVKNTLSGTDLMEELVRLSAEKGFVVGFLGGRKTVAKKTAECLLRKYPGLKVAFSESGPVVDKDGREVLSENSERLRQPEDQNIRKSDILDLRSSDLSGTPSSSESFRIPPTDILFIAFGHIKQEKWIANNLDKIPVKLAMGVGGAFDYLSGLVPRAPKWMRSLGFEWLFRLIVQPWRIKRQISLLQYLWLLTKGR